MRLLAVVLPAALVSIATPALANPALPADRGIDYQIVEPDPASRARNATGPDTLYMNRCVGNCTIYSGGNDATANSSSIPSSTSTLTEFAYTDAQWDAVVACVRETYLPYGVDVVTTEPSPITEYVEVMVAGSPDELGLDPNTLGIAPMAGDCSAQVNWIAFAFANVHGTDPVLDLCATVAHEAGHVYGLDHEYDCKDPMTYLVGCGQKYFLNVAARCGEFDGPRDCRCTGATQNSHIKLTSVLGEGTLPPPPQVSIPYPMPDASVIQEFTMFGEVIEPRVVDRVEFWLNDWPWRTFEGVRDQTQYTYTADETLPDGIIDIEVRAYNDLEVMGSATITVTKGAPCTSAETCLEGQFCEEGRCAWPEPTGVLGDTCAYDAECVSRQCESDGTHSVCTEPCTPDLAGDCEAGYTCLAAGDGGVCWPEELLDDGGGCCSTSSDPVPSSALAGLVALFILRRRRSSPTRRTA